MTLGNKIAWDDTVLPFQLDNSDVRGRLARLDGVLDQVLTQHNYPKEIEALVAEATILTAMIGQAIKLRWKLSLQIRGDGGARLIATDYYAPTGDGEPGMIRAYASYDEEKVAAGGTGIDLVGKGFFAVLIDQGEGTSPYTGMTPITGNSLSDSAQAYFAQSEQIPTRFHSTFGKSMWGDNAGWRAGGVMLQHMPKASPHVAPEGGTGEDGVLQAADLLTPDDAENWNRANHLLNSVEELELVGPSVTPTDLLFRLFHEEAPRVFDPQAVRFGCTCSEDRVRQSLSIYSAKDLTHMTTDDGRITADCQFCGAKYDLDPATVGKDVQGSESDD